jgi:hypothetical protein
MRTPSAVSEQGEAFVRASLRKRVDSVEVSTIVYLPPADVYEFLVDFPGYAEYSKYLDGVHSDGDGGPGTRYALRFAWWKLTYTAHTKVTDVDPPDRVDWTTTKNIDADGFWAVRAVPDEAPPDAETASRVTLRVDFDPDSVGGVDLPRFVSVAWVIQKVTPLIQEEAERVVERIVADLEGESRPVDLRIHATPDSV